MPQTLTCSRSMEMPVVAETNKPFLVPFNRNPHFVGRVEDLHDLHTALQADEAVGIIPAGITGMGGIGKTQLAVEYVYQHRADSDGSRAISASDDRTLKVWNLETGEELISISLDGSLYCLVCIISITWGSSGRSLTAPAGGTVRRPATAPKY